MRDPSQRKQLEILVRDLWYLCLDTHYDKLELSKSAMECKEARIGFMSLLVDGEEEDEGE